MFINIFSFFLYFFGVHGLVKRGGHSEVLIHYHFGIKEFEIEFKLGLN